MMPNITGVVGKNFSGRTEYLRRRAGLMPGQIQSICGAYIGPEIYNTLSGLGATVRKELIIQNKTKQSLDELAANFALQPLLSRNPFTLSGGEQTMLALAAACANNTSFLAIDSVLEQLHPSLKPIAVEALRRAGVESIAICDNRSRELSVCFESEHTPASPSSNGDQLPIKALNSAMFCPHAQTSFRLVLDNVHYWYLRGFPVLSKCSIELQPGRVYCLRGKNGAGKSTFGKLLAGLLRPKSGTIFANGQAIKPWHNPGCLLAYHFQNPDFQLFASSLAKEVEFSRYCLERQAGLLSLFRRHKVNDIQWRMKILNSFGLEALLQEHPLDMPFVLRKRIALAATLAMPAPWLLLDEPTLGQDDETCLEIVQMIRKLAAVGRGIVVISHSDWFCAQLDAISLFLEGGQLCVSAGGMNVSQVP